MKLVLALTLLFVTGGFAAAQKGNAEPDYYPMNYSGDTWSGEVTSVDESTRQFTLTYKKGEKEQTFVAVLGKGYTVKMKDGRDHELKMSELLGTRVKIYYMTKTEKDANGVKVKTHNVFRLKFIKD